jgi:hypothetical protein
MRRALAAAAVLAFALSPVLAGCTDDDGQSPTPTDSSPPPSGHTTTPGSTTSDPVDEPPVLPDAAKAQTTAGAKAFVSYFVDTVNYGYLQQNPAPLDEASGRTCLVCQALVKNIDSLRRQGGRQVDGQWEVTKVNSLAATGDQERVLLSTVKIHPGRSRASADEEFKPIHRSTTFYEFHVVWSRGHWLATDLRTG